MQWDLSCLYTGFEDEHYAADLSQLNQLVDAQTDYLNSHAQLTPAALEDMLRALNQIKLLSSRLDLFPRMTLATNAGDESAQAALDKLVPLQNRIKLLTSLLTARIGVFAETDLEHAIAASPYLMEHAFILREYRALSKHLLPAELEPIVLKLQATGSSASEQLRDRLEANHTIDLDGKETPFMVARKLYHSPDPAVRRKLYHAEIASYRKMEWPMAACLNCIKGETLTLLPLRNYSSPLEQTLELSRMDALTLETMLAEMRRALPMFRRYLRAKARLLGYGNGLPYYELTTAVTASGGSSAEADSLASRQYTLDDARALLLDTLGRFSPNLRTVIRRAFDERWLDTEPHAGKRGGAFCARAQTTGTSMVFSNFNGGFSDVSTLAHELGHAYHNDCIYRMSPLNTAYPMPLAETASIFNQTLLFNSALDSSSDADALQLLNEDLTDSTQVIVDILSRYIFETEVFKRRADHQLSPAELKQVMADAQIEAYGDGLDAELLHPYMWACKSHYYSASRHFYNFPYAFGLLFGRGVYAKYVREGAAFVPQYEGMLAAAGSGTVVDVAKYAEIDLHSAEFWRSSLDMIAAQVERFCALAERCMSN